MSRLPSLEIGHNTLTPLQTCDMIWLVPCSTFLWLLPFAAWDIDYEVHVVAGDTPYTDVTPVARSLMSKCLVMTKPVVTLTGVTLERPCTSDIRGRYLYVVMVLLNADASSMGISDLKVYSSRF